MPSSRLRCSAPMVMQCWPVWCWIRWRTGEGEHSKRMRRSPNVLNNTFLGLKMMQPIITGFLLGIPIKKTDWELRNLLKKNVEKYWMVETCWIHNFVVFSSLFLLLLVKYHVKSEKFAEVCCEHFLDLLFEELNREDPEAPPNNLTKRPRNSWFAWRWLSTWSKQCLKSIETRRRWRWRMAEVSNTPSWL